MQARPRYQVSQYKPGNIRDRPAGAENVEHEVVVPSGRKFGADPIVNLRLAGGGDPAFERDPPHRHARADGRAGWILFYWRPDRGRQRINFLGA